MSNVFWFTGVSCSGKTTLTKNLEKILAKDFSIKVIDGDEVVSKLGGIEFRRKYHDEFIKKIVNLVHSSSKQNELILVAVMAPKQKQRNYAKKILGDKFYSIYLQCSDACIISRMEKRTIKKENALKIEKRKKRSLGIVRNIKKILQILSIVEFSPNSYEVPKSPDLIINTEKETVEKSIDNALTFVYSKVLESSVTEVLEK